jgi:hypothetical protein
MYDLVGGPLYIGIWVTCTLDRKQAHQNGITCGTEEGTTLTSLRNIIKTKPPIAVAQKAQQLPPPPEFWLI